MRRIGTRACITSLLAIFAMLLVACGGGGSSTTTGGGNTPAAPKAKVALVTDIGGLNDNGFNHLAYTGYKKAETQYGFPEKIIQTQSQGDYVKNLTSAAQSADLVIAVGFLMETPLDKVAKQFPKVYFEHCTGYKQAKNCATYNIRFYESRYVQGVIAGKLSKSGVVGYIGSVPIPEVVMGMNAVMQGLRSVNPNGKIKIIWVNGWYDPGKEGDSAKALIDQGCDIICQHTDSAAPLQVAEQRGMHGFGEASDMIKLAPKAQLSSLVDHWNDYYVQRVTATINNN